MDVLPGQLSASPGAARSARGRWPPSQPSQPSEVQTLMTSPWLKLSAGDPLTSGGEADIGEESLENWDDTSGSEAPAPRARLGEDPSMKKRLANQVRYRKSRGSDLGKVSTTVLHTVWDSGFSTDDSHTCAEEDEIHRPAAVQGEAKSLYL
ncbi:unnamed protein product [Effrenium voratum]|nr:unnamed protein product [Effrenium voratum]